MDYSLLTDFIRKYLTLMYAELLLLTKTMNCFH